MSGEKEFNEIFSKKLKYFLNQYDMTQAELAKRLGVGTTTVSEWCNGKKTPRMSKVDAMCEIFHCTRSDFLTDETPTTQAYYLNPETARVAQEIFDDPNKRILFDAAENATPDQLQKAAQYIEFLKWVDADNDDPA